MSQAEWRCYNITVSNADLSRKSFCGKDLLLCAGQYDMPCRTSARGKQRLPQACHPQRRQARGPQAKATPSAVQASNSIACASHIPSRTYNHASCNLPQPSSRPHIQRQRRTKNRGFQRNSAKPSCSLKTAAAQRKEPQQNGPDAPRANCPGNSRHRKYRRLSRDDEPKTSCAAHCEHRRGSARSSTRNRNT